MRKPRRGLVLTAKRDAMVAVWVGRFLPPRDITAATEEAAVAPPEAASAPGVARVAGMVTLVFVLNYYVLTSRLGPEGALPLGFVLRSYGPTFAVGVVALGLLARSGSRLGAWASLALYIADCAGWLLTGVPVDPVWISLAASLTCFYLWAAVSVSRPRRAAAPAAEPAA